MYFCSNMCWPIQSPCCGDLSVAVKKDCIWPFLVINVFRSLSRSILHFVEGMEVIAAKCSCWSVNSKHTIRIFNNWGIIVHWWNVSKYIYSITVHFKSFIFSICTLLEYFHFLLFCTFYSITSQREIFNFLLHCPYLTANVLCRLRFLHA